MRPARVPAGIATVRAIAACTYALRSRIETMEGVRYILRRSDGRVLNLGRAEVVRIQRQGKLDLQGGVL